MSSLESKTQCVKTLTLLPEAGAVFLAAAGGIFIHSGIQRMLIINIINDKLQNVTLKVPYPTSVWFYLILGILFIITALYILKRRQRQLLTA